MKNREKALGTALLIHLLLSLVVGGVLVGVKTVLRSDTAFNMLSLILTLLRYGIPIAFYCKTSGYVPFTSSLNAPCTPLNERSTREKVFLFVLALSLAVATVNAVGVLTDILFSLLGRVEESGAVAVNGTVFSFIKTVLLAAFVEEILFRGALLHALSDRKDGTRIVISAIAFALMHGNIGQFFYALAAGLIISAVAIISNSLLLSVLVHLGVNLVSFVFYVLKGALAEGVYTWVALSVIITAAVIGVACAVFYVLKMRKKENPTASAEGEGYPIELTAYLFAAALVTVIASLI